MGNELTATVSIPNPGMVDTTLAPWPPVATADDLPQTVPDDAVSGYQPEDSEALAQANAIQGQRVTPLWRPVPLNSTDFLSATDQMLAHSSWQRFGRVPTLPEHERARLTLVSRYLAAHDLDWDSVRRGLSVIMGSDEDLEPMDDAEFDLPDLVHARRFMEFSNIQGDVRFRGMGSGNDVSGYSFDSTRWRAERLAQTCPPIILHRLLPQLFPQGSTILDLMGGDGTFSLKWAEGHPDNQVILIDGCGENLSCAAHEANRRGLSPERYQLIYQDARGPLLLPDASIDHVMLLGYPTYRREKPGSQYRPRDETWNLHRLYADVLRVLRPGGSILLEFMHKDWVGIAEDADVIEELLIEKRMHATRQNMADGLLVHFTLQKG